MFRKKRTYEVTVPGDKKHEPPSRDEERLISRRVLLMRGVGAIGFAALAGKLWQMQIAQGSEYEDVVEGNVLRFERIKSARGNIVDRTGLVLAENRRAWTVRIVPAWLPDDEEERQQVLDEVSNMLDLGSALVLDRRRIPLGSESAVVKSLTERLEGLQSDSIMAQLDKADTTLVMLRDNLSQVDADSLREQVSDIPGIRVLGVLDYQLATHLTMDRAMLVKTDVERELALTISANALYLPGVEVDDNDLIRQYSAGPAFSHILGYVGPITEDEYTAAETVTGTAIYDPDDVVGRGGVEQALEQEMRGTKGGRWVQVDSEGVERFEILSRRREPISGLSVQLTIDREFQKIVTKALQDGIDYANKKALEQDREPVGAGVAIAMNPQNGEILAMVSLPNFDNQQFVDGISQAQFDQLSNDPYTPLLNRAISGTYAPGSTFKPLMAMMGLEEEVIDTETKIKCAGELRVPWSWDESQGNDYLCWVGRPGHGKIDIYSGIADSCDVFFYNVGAPRDKPDADEFPNADFLHYYNPGDTERHYFNGLGIDRIARYLNKEFGFGSQSGIELAGEAEGQVPTPAWLRQTFEGQYWSVGDTINVSIGQGHLLCTPLQLLNATAAISNRGTLWQPRLVKALLRDDGHVVKQYPAREIQKVNIKPEHFETVRLGMRQTVTKGTALGKITVQDPPIAAKSGTAEYGVAVDGRYKKSHAWFTAFGPFENPEIAVGVLVVSGDAGSVYAGPVANDILTAYFA